jgi:hypothetical protein
MALTITPSTAEKIRERLRLYLSGEVQKWPGWDSEALGLQALPILPDLLTIYFLRPDGELFKVDFFEDVPKPEIEKDIHTKVTVISIATEWFPIRSQTCFYNAGTSREVAGPSLEYGPCLCNSHR